MKTRTSSNVYPLRRKRKLRNRAVKVLVLFGIFMVCLLFTFVYKVEAFRVKVVEVAGVETRRLWDELWDGLGEDALAGALEALETALEQAGLTGSSEEFGLGVRLSTGAGGGLNKQGRKRAAALAEALAPLRAALCARLPEAQAGESLSRQAIWVLTSIPGVSCVLVGMRRPRYVEDALGVMPLEELPGAADVLMALRAE